MTTERKLLLALAVAIVLFDMAIPRPPREPKPPRVEPERKPGLTITYGPPLAKWDGHRFVCPAGTSQWADEPAAIAGSDEYVYCVEDKWPH